MLPQILRFISIMGVLFALAPAWVPTSLAASKSNPSQREKLADELFNSLIPRLQIEISASALSNLRDQPRQYTPATIREGATVYTNVAVKLKGGRGSWRSVDGRPGLTLNFDKLQPGQRFHGLDKVHLNNGVQDYTMMNEIIGGEIFRSAGIPAARATHARITINGEDADVYVLKESFDQAFLKRHFKRTDGNLYDGGFVQDINGPLEKDSGRGPDDRSDLQHLYAAAMEPDLARRETLLAQNLDLDRFITFTALERLVGHWDGYTANRNNYRLYHDPGSDRFVFFPHGMDQLFRDSNYPIMARAQAGSEGRSGRGDFGRGGFGRGGFGRGSVLANKVFEVPDLQRRYIERVGELLAKNFTAEKLLGEVTRIEERIRKHLLPADGPIATNLLRQASLVRGRLESRAAAVRVQFEAISKPASPEQK